MIRKPYSQSEFNDKKGQEQLGRSNTAEQLRVEMVHNDSILIAHALEAGYVQTVKLDLGKDGMELQVDVVNEGAGKFAVRARDIKANHVLFAKSHFQLPKNGEGKSLSVGRSSASAIHISAIYKDVSRNHGVLQIAQNGNAMSVVYADNSRNGTKVSVYKATDLAASLKASTNVAIKQNSNKRDIPHRQQSTPEVGKAFLEEYGFNKPGNEFTTVSSSNLEGVLMRHYGTGHSKYAQNEDNIFWDVARQEFAVADGMGSYGDGDKASATIVKYLKAKEDPADAARKGHTEILHTLKKVDGEGNVSYAGSTLAHVKINGAILKATWLGDSRVIIFDPNGDLKFISHDHAEVNSKYHTKPAVNKYGIQINLPQEYLAAEGRNVVTGGVGGRNGEINIRQAQIQLVSGDTIVVGSDGLFDNMNSYQVAQYVAHAKNNGASNAQIGQMITKDMLEGMQRSKGGLKKDNISFGIFTYRQ